MVASLRSHRTALRLRGVPALRTPFGRGHNSAWSFRIARKLACGSPLCPQFAIVVWHLRTVLAFGGPVFRPCGLRFALCPRGSSRFAAFDCALRYRLQFSFAHWTSASPVSATGGGEAPSPLGLLRPVSATGGGLRAPPPVSAKILRISGRGNCRETIFALENGIFRRGVLRAHAPLNSAWSFRIFAPPCADACAVFRGCALRFAPCARHFSPSGLRRSQARLRLSLLHWAYFALFRALRARFVRFLNSQWSPCCA